MKTEKEIIEQIVDLEVKKKQLFNSKDLTDRVKEQVTNAVVATLEWVLDYEKSK